MKNPPGIHAHVSTDVNLPAGPYGLAWACPSTFQVPTKTSSRLCSAPGFGVEVEDCAPSAIGAMTNATIQAADLIDMCLSCPFTKRTTESPEILARHVLTLIHRRAREFKRPHPTSSPEACQASGGSR